MRVKKRFGAALVVAAVLVCASGATTAFADDLASTETPVVSAQPTESAPTEEETPQDVSTEPQNTVSAPVVTPVATPEPEKVEQTQQTTSSESPAEQLAPVVETVVPAEELAVTPETNTATPVTPTPLAEEEPWVPQSSPTMFPVECSVEGEDVIIGADYGPRIEDEEFTIDSVDGVTLEPGLFMTGPGEHTFSYTVWRPSHPDDKRVLTGTFTVLLCDDSKPSAQVTSIVASAVDEGGVRSVNVSGTVSLTNIDNPDDVLVVVSNDKGNSSAPLTIDANGNYSTVLTGEFPDGMYTISAQAYLQLAHEMTPTGTSKSTSVEFVTSETPTKVIDAKVVGDYECNVYEWHFVITQTSESQAPSTITVKFANGEEVVVSLDRVTGKTAHYTTMEHLDSSVVSASAGIDEDWDGQFNLSHGPCAVTPVTYKAPEPVAIDLCGVDDDAVVIPEYDASKGFFTLYGEKVAPGTYSVVGPTARVAFQFADGVDPAEGSFLSKVYEYSQKPCDVTPPTENPNPNPNPNPDPTTPKPTPVTPTPVPAGNGGGSDKGSSDDNLAATGLDASSLGHAALGALGLMAMGALALLRRRRSV